MVFAEAAFVAVLETVMVVGGDFVELMETVMMTGCVLVESVETAITGSAFCDVASVAVVAELVETPVAELALVVAAAAVPRKSRD